MTDRPRTIPLIAGMSLTQAACIGPIVSYGFCALRDELMALSPEALAERAGTDSPAEGEAWRDTFLNDCVNVTMTLMEVAEGACMELASQMLTAKDASNETRQAARDMMAALLEAAEARAKVGEDESAA